MEKHIFVILTELTNEKNKELCISYALDCHKLEIKEINLNELIRNTRIRHVTFF